MRGATHLGALAAAVLTALSCAEGAAPPSSSEPPKEWAYRTPTRPAVPAIRGREWPRNPIDRFVLARLEKEGLTPSPEADRATLVRRVTFDLTGLPPTPAELEAFSRDRSPGAYERLVDRLLASPAHGMHAATSWLDLARFAETDGFKADDPRPDAWRYRDYVVRSLNADKPYDRFVREQIAGDELYPADQDARIATGFNRHFPDEYNAVNLEQRRQEILNDMTDTTASVFLGLTVGCARCHDHKFDPIPQRDYYRLQAFFAGFAEAAPPLANRAAVERHDRQVRAWEEKTADLRKRMGEMEQPVARRLSSGRRFRFPKEYQHILDVPAGKRTPLERQLAAMMDKQVRADRGAVVAAMKPEVRKQWQTLAKELDAFAALKPAPLPRIMAVTEVGPVPPLTFVLRRGDWRKHGKEVPPGFLAALGGGDAKVPAPAPGARTSGRRSALAKWLTSPKNPLTARVLVNRLWQQRFGHGIVATPGDFGAQGEPPTHPELLDWLAVELIERGWSVKAVDRLIVTSATYRQSSRWDSARGRKDPENRLLWRKERRRLDGEALRDAFLAVSGRLDRKAGGPGVFPELPPELGKVRGWKASADPRERDRRSVYVYVKRNLRYPLFGAFDAPDRNDSCPRRHATTTAPQALMLLNSKTVLDHARSFAGRVLAGGKVGADEVAERAYRLALGRSPDDQERKTVRAFLRRQAEELRPRLCEKSPPPGPLPAQAGVDPAFAAAVVDLCHAVLNLNEFLYMD
jgi:hypothetical protein